MTRVDFFVFYSLFHLPGPRMGPRIESIQYSLHERTDTIHRHIGTHMR